MRISLLLFKIYGCNVLERFPISKSTLYMIYLDRQFFRNFCHKVSCTQLLYTIDSWILIWRLSWILSIYSITHLVHLYCSRFIHMWGYVFFFSFAILNRMLKGCVQIYNITNHWVSVLQHIKYVCLSRFKRHNFTDTKF